MYQTLLKISREKASRKILRQIERGKEIANFKIVGENDFREFVNLNDIWLSHTYDVLTLLFDDEIYANRFDNTSVVNSKTQMSIYEKARFLKEEIYVKVGFLETIIENLDLIPEKSSLNFETNTETTSIIQTDSRDTKVVFVVHGRNLSARKSIFQFLRSIGLHPLEWSQAVDKTGKTTPYVGEVLDAAFSIAQAAIILFTPDDEARLREQYRGEKEPTYEMKLTPQARQNVIFEAGMAMGMFPDRTVLVEIGELRPMSDISGRHVVRLNNTIAKRQELAQRLKTAGCAVNLIGTDWHEEGNFELPPIPKKKPIILK